MKILLIGEMWPGSLGYFYKKAFEKLKVNVSTFSVGPKSFPIDIKKQSKFSKLWKNRITRKIMLEFLNFKLLEFFRRNKSDVAIFFKGCDFFPETIKKLKNKVYLINIFNDDIFYPLTSSRFAVESIGLYDLYLTPCKFMIPELKNSGAKKVEYLPFAFDVEFHKPIKMDYVYDVTFIGSYRPERELLFCELVKKNLSFTFRIFGNGWYNTVDKSLFNYIEGYPVYPEKLSEYISSTKINIALNTYFGSKNRSIHTMRHFEIPASNGFMLCEYNLELKNFFNNDLFFFTDAKDLKMHIDYFLKNPSEIESIKLKVSKYLNGNSYIDRAKFIIDRINF